jgi:hypothetical protein
MHACRARPLQSLVFVQILYTPVQLRTKRLLGDVVERDLYPRRLALISRMHPLVVRQGLPCVRIRYVANWRDREGSRPSSKAGVSWRPG